MHVPATSQWLAVQDPPMPGLPRHCTIGRSRSTPAKPWVNEYVTLQHLLLPLLQLSFLFAAEYMRTFDICTKLLEENHDNMAAFTSSSSSSSSSFPSLGSRSGSRRGGSLLSSSGSNRNFRRQYNGNLGGNNNCKLMVYGRQQFQDLEVTLTSNQRYVNLGEKSLRTIGNCCWVLFRYLRGVWKTGHVSKGKLWCLLFSIFVYF